MDEQFSVTNSTLIEQFSYHGFATYETASGRAVDLHNDV